MKIKISLASRIRKQLAAFSLVEAVIGMGVMGTVVGALLSGFTTGFFTMRMARENLRATQIMLEKMETIRLYSWQQVTNQGWIPTTFTNYYDPQTLNNKGIAYQGELIIANAPISSSYSNTMKLVTVRLKWKTGNVQRQREFSSYISKYGLQDYVY
jgi:uncharacterized protein (TIGR02598 family)